MRLIKHSNEPSLFRQVSRALRVKLVLEKMQEYVYEIAICGTSKEVLKEIK